MEGRTSGSPDPALELVAKLAFPFVLVGIFAVPTVLIPSWRYLCVVAFLKLKLLEAGLIARDELAFIGRVFSEVQALSPQGLSPGLALAVFSEVVRGAPKTTLLSGLVFSALLAVVGGGLIGYLRFRARSVDFREAIENFRRASLAEVLARYGVHDELPSDPVRAATWFAGIRRKKNIPPNVVARKVEDPVLRRALFWWPRVVRDKPEVMWPVDSPVELAEFLAASVKAAEKGNEELEALRKKVEAAFATLTEGGQGQTGAYARG